MIIDTGVLPAVVALALAAMLAGFVPVVVRTLPAPVGAPPGWSYAPLCGRGFAVATAAAMAAALLVTFWRIDAAARPTWAVLGTVGVLAAAIDARTGYLPAPLCRVAAAAACVTVGAAAVLGAGGWRAAAALGSGALLTGVMWLVWRSGRGLGFGDVRLAAVIGVVAGTGGVLAALWSLAVGALIAAVLGLVLGLCGRRGSFPFGPALVAGPFLAALLGLAG